MGPLNSIDDFGEVAKDRFHLACSISEFRHFSPYNSSKTGIKIYETYLNNESMGTHYFNRLDSGESIIKIYEMTCLSTDEKRKKGRQTIRTGTKKN